MRGTSLAAIGLLLSACGASTPSTSTGPQPADDDTSPLSRLVVDSTYRPGRSGADYTEGALVEVVVETDQGEVVATRSAQPGETLTIPGLQPGTYQVIPALRPCDGSCGALDPRTDGCAQDLTLTGTIRLQVDFRVGKPCTITAPDAASQPAETLHRDATPITLGPAACATETVYFDGRAWTLPGKERAADELPGSWVGEGLITRTAQDEARYTDRSGTEVLLVPAGPPGGQPPDHLVCD